MNRLRKIFVVFLGVLFIFIGGVFSKPVVENVSGNFSHKSSIVIHGEGFGSKNVSEPEIWDTVDNIDDYNNISDGYVLDKNEDKDIPGPGPWPSIKAGIEYRTYKSRNQRHNFSTASYYGEESGGTVGGYKVKNGEDLYFSWWWYPSKEFDPEGSSNKFLRAGSQNNMGAASSTWRSIQFGAGGDDRLCRIHGKSEMLWNEDTTYEVDDMAGHPDENDECHQYIATAQNTNVEPPNEDYWFEVIGWEDCNVWPDWGGEYGEWNRLEVYYKNDEMTGWVKVNGDKIVDEEEFDWSHPDVIEANYPKITVAQMIGLNVNRQVEDLKMDMDDIYVDSTQAKIELCNKSNWTEIENNGSHCEIQIPKNWSKESIKIEFNQGAFKENDKAYLFVVDENGSVNEQGYQINISGETPAIHPADINYDGRVSFSEINNYIDKWLNDEITIDELLSGINEWRRIR